MNVLAELRARFEPVLSEMVDDPGPMLDMIRPAKDPKFGDYQANCAMPLKKTIDKPPREIAQLIVDGLQLDDICEPPEIAGPGFINLRLKDDWISAQLHSSLNDRLGVSTTDNPRTIVIDYSSPNVAKPMHVGHIRSTVIGDALSRTLRFLGHNVISDNHLGDWGTQFGMIIHGYKNFVDVDAFARQPVAELSRLYRLVNQILDFPKKCQRRDLLAEELSEHRRRLERLDESEEDAKKTKKEAKRLNRLIGQAEQQIADLSVAIEASQRDAQLMSLVQEHSNIATAVLSETAKLHDGDEENIRLWNEFLPNCRDEIQRVYKRLDIEFDFEYGESFYHDRLATVVETLQKKGLARESDGAMCVFLDGFATPMIVRKQDGAFLYATTDLATIQYRIENWQPDTILYVVDFRQAEHFDKLFSTARLLGCQDVELQHVKFGTVTDKSGKPYKTRSGEVAGLEGLLDDAVNRAFEVVSEKSKGLDEEQRRVVAQVVGHGAIKYYDLNHNRESDYKFDVHEMTRPDGNTTTYMQYAYARICGIFAKANTSQTDVRAQRSEVLLPTPAERKLAVDVLRFEEVLKEVEQGYFPNHLTTYLYEDLSKSLTSFYDNCPVAKDGVAEKLRDSRLLLCDLVASTIRKGLELLGIKVVDRM